MRKSEEKHYVSCIKINGVPILPPLITPAKLKEIRRYKKQAIKVERRIERERAWKEYAESFCEARNAYSQTSFSEVVEDPTQSENETDKSESISKVQSKLTCNIQASEYINNKFVIFNSSAVEEEQSSKLEAPKIGLIRSNSYILETPSPVLVEHLKKAKGAEEQPLVLEDLSVSKCSDYTYCDISDTETELKFVSDNESHSQVSEKEYHLKQFIDNNVPGGNRDFSLSDDVLSKVIAEQTQTNDSCKADEQAIVNDTFGALKDVLKDIPEEYGKQILKILEKQSLERDFRIETYNKLQNDLNSQHNGNDSYSIQGNGGNIEVSEVEKPSTQIGVQSRGIERSSKLHKYGPKEEKAASIIGAFVKGYLTRRLMQTAKVQNLIQIIKDALLCAVQLHSESLENIEESDVELHRRLIQQVSAACYAFHDVFFNLPIQDQMSIIATDRQKKLEKLLRPTSSSSLTAKQTPRRSLRSTPSVRSTTSV